MRTFLLTLLAAAVTAARLHSADAPEQKRPNIVFIFSDDHALQAIGSYPSWLQEFIKKNNVTPNIEKLANDGVIFDRSFCGNSICSPSRATILTGKHSYHNGITEWQTFDGSQTTFPKLLQQAGYQTALIGKWHLQSVPTGFDYWRILNQQGEYYNPVLTGPKGTERIEGYCTEVVTDLGLKWIEQGRDPQKPFLLMLQHKAPHRTWMPAPQYLHFLDDVTIPEPSSLFDDYAGREAAAKHRMGITKHLELSYDLKMDPPEEAWAKRKDGTPVKPVSYARLTPEQAKMWSEKYGPLYSEFKKANLSGEALTRWKFQRYMKDYLACVKSVDDSVGQVREYLKKVGLDENTIVIYCSDQGFYLGEHGWFDKRWMYEESLKMPLIVSWPGVTKSGTRVPEMVQNIDYAPTFLEIAGARAPEEMQGVSLMPLLKGEPPANWRKSIYYHYYNFPGSHGVALHEGVRGERYKLIKFSDSGAWEFYDLSKDPNEMHNAVDEPANKEAVAQMKEELARLKTFYRIPDGKPIEKAK